MALAGRGRQSDRLAITQKITEWKWITAHESIEERSDEKDNRN
jgi:hypothetical protein